MKEEKSDSLELNDLKKEINDLKRRIGNVESKLQNVRTQDSIKGNVTNFQEDFEVNLTFSPKGSVEFGIGEYGMAWLGNIVLFFGILFLIQFLHNAGNSFLSIVAGVISVSGIYLGAYFLRNTYSILSNLLTYNAHFLLFYITLRLHFVSENQMIQNHILGLSFLVVVLGFLFVLSIRKKSQLMSGLVMIMMIVSGLISNSGHFLLAITTLTALLSIYLYHRFGWIKLVILFILFTSFTHLIWLLNNPFITGEPVLRGTNKFEYIYLIATAFVFSLLAILPPKEKISNDILIGTIVWNGLCFSSLLLLTIISWFQENYIYILGAITLFCLFYALILQVKSLLKITASFYAIYGFIALSIVIFGISGFPKAYLLLSVQSLLVVSVALWFRSRFLVIMNTLLFIGLMVFYLKDQVNYNSTNFAFLLVAFITARVINWKKERLTLKTEFIRNLYLIAGFVMTLVAFYHAIPESFVIVSWIGCALLFFLLSYLLKNIKYRWLAIATMIASAVHLIFIDMAKMNVSYRIIVFLLLALISLTVSIVYTKHFIKRKEE